MSAWDADLDAPVAPDLHAGRIDLDQLRVLRHDRRQAEADAEIEQLAQQQHHVGLSDQVRRLVLRQVEEALYESCVGCPNGAQVNLSVRFM